MNVSVKQIHVNESWFVIDRDLKHQESFKTEVHLGLIEFNQR